METFELLKQQASGIFPAAYPDIGNLIVIDGSLIDGVLSMDWAGIENAPKKQKRMLDSASTTGLCIKRL